MNTLRRSPRPPSMLGRRRRQRPTVQLAAARVGEPLRDPATSGSRQLRGVQLAVADELFEQGVLRHVAPPTRIGSRLPRMSGSSDFSLASSATE
jgi:hypothetical protein